ncbi:hypothetical protein [Algoriphagus hitonicola]
MNAGSVTNTASASTNLRRQYRYSRHRRLDCECGSDSGLDDREEHHGWRHVRCSWRPGRIQLPDHQQRQCGIGRTVHGD